jgi:hypothetical protein
MYHLYLNNKAEIEASLIEEEGMMYLECVETDFEELQSLLYYMQLAANASVTQLIDKMKEKIKQKRDIN